MYLYHIIISDEYWHAANEITRYSGFSFYPENSFYRARNALYTDTLYTTSIIYSDGNFKLNFTIYKVAGNLGTFDKIQIKIFWHLWEW